MRTTTILEGKQREEALLKASNEVLRYFAEEFSFAELQSCIIEGCKAMFLALRQRTQRKPMNMARWCRKVTRL